MEVIKDFTRFVKIYENEKLIKKSGVYFVVAVPDSKTGKVTLKLSDSVIKPSKSPAENPRFYNLMGDMSDFPEFGIKWEKGIKKYKIKKSIEDELKERLIGSIEEHEEFEENIGNGLGGDDEWCQENLKDNAEDYFWDLLKKYRKLKCEKYLSSDLYNKVFISGFFKNVREKFKIDAKKESNINIKDVIEYKKDLSFFVDITNELDEDDYENHSTLNDVVSRCAHKIIEWVDVE